MTNEQHELNDRIEAFLEEMGTVPNPKHHPKRFLFAWNTYWYRTNPKINEDINLQEAINTNT